MEKVKFVSIFFDDRDKKSFIRIKTKTQRKQKLLNEVKLQIGKNPILSMQVKTYELVKPLKQQKV